MTGVSVRFYRCVYYIAWLVFRIGHPVLRVRGKENLPEGPAVISCNHSAFSDPVWVVLASKPKRPYRVMAKEELFKIPVFRWLIRKVGAFPVDREANDINAVKTALKALRDGDKLLIFPEGTRVHEDVPPAAHGGAMLLTTRAKVPIVPVYITRRKRFLRPIDVVFGEAYEPQIAGRKATSEELESLTAEMMKKIYALEDML